MFTMEAEESKMVQHLRAVSLLLIPRMLLMLLVVIMLEPALRLQMLVTWLWVLGHSKRLLVLLRESMLSQCLHVVLLLLVLRL
jgi:ABC-type antimicrobial peptide transport system permease subunit